MRFIWIDYNRDKISLHALSEREVEFAWRASGVLYKGVHEAHGPFTVSAGECPSGRPITISWRTQIDWDGEEKVYVITAY